MILSSRSRNAVYSLSPAVSILAVCLVIAAFTSGGNTLAVSAKSVSSPLPKGFDKLIDGAGSDMKGGNYPIAETKLKTALEMLSKSKDTEDKLLTAEILSNMCLCQMSDLRYLEALKSATRSFEIYKQIPGQRETLATKASKLLGQVYIKLNRYKEAREILQKSLVSYERVFGTRSRETFSCLRYLALAEAGAGDFTASEAIWKKLLAERNSMGVADSELSAALDEYGLLLFFLGRDKEAAGYLESALKLDVSNHGSDSVGSETSAHNLALVYSSLGRMDEAESMMRHYLDSQESRFGKDSVEYALGLASLANCLTKQQRYDEAVSLFREALRIQEAQLSPDHQDLAETLNNLAFSLEGLNRKSEAEGLYLRAQVIYKKRTGSQSLSVASIQRSLGFLYCDQERYAEAFPLLKEAFDTRKSILPELSQEVGDGYADMGDYYDWKREPEKSEANFRKALFIYTKLKGADCKDAQVARTKLQRLAKERLGQRVN